LIRRGRGEEDVDGEGEESLEGVPQAEAGAGDREEGEGLEGEEAPGAGAGRPGEGRRGGGGRVDNNLLLRCGKEMVEIE